MRIITWLTSHLLLVVLIGNFAIYSQSEYQTTVDSSLYASYQESLDTLEIFQLLDSLIELESLRSSQLSFHLGYISEVSNAGRTLDVKQYGFNPGISYFHRSGLYANVTGYWNSDLDPHYDLTVVSLGYIGFLSPKLSYSMVYDHSFFTDTEVDLDLPQWAIELLIPPILNNSFSAGLDLDLGGIETGVDYSWLFNDESAHRVYWRLTGDFKKYKWLGMDRVSLRPAFEMLFGNADIISVTFSREALIQNRFPYLINNENEFGLMNYRLRIPVGFTKRSFQLIAEYNFNIPVSLPGEDFEYPNNSFFSLDLYYNFAIGTKKSIFE